MHFTYEPPPGREVPLRQGDILKRTEPLEALLKSIHPHYARDDYRYFIILTQSCDLAHNTGNNTAVPYISIAAVRPLEVVLSREIEKYKRDDYSKLANIVTDDNRKYAKDFLIKLLNNNVPDYFYLEAEPDYGFTDNSCAFLRLSVAIKSHENYPVCQDARILGLKEAFRAKLGWLVGHIYSRVGTEDWTPANMSTNDFGNRVEEELNALCLWYDKRAYDYAKKQITQKFAQGLMSVMSKDSLREAFKNEKPPHKRFQVAQRSIEVLQEMEVIPKTIDVKRLVNAIYQDISIVNLVK